MLGLVGLDLFRIVCLTDCGSERKTERFILQRIFNYIPVIDRSSVQVYFLLFFLNNDICVDYIRGTISFMQERMYVERY